MDRLSDTQIRAGLRNIMSYHRIDLNKTSFICAGGIVRMTGDLQRQAAYGSLPISGLDVESLEKDINRVKGVVRVHMDLRGWRRGAFGEWKMIDKPARPVAAEEETEKEESEDRIELGELPPIPWTSI